MGENASRIELSPLGFLHHSATVMAEREAIVYGKRRYTYAELAERVGRLAAALRAKGVERGDRVAVLCPNTPAIFEAHFGIPAAGAIIVAINTRLSEDEVHHILSDSEPRLVIADHQLAGLVEGCDVELVRVDDTGEEGDPYEDLLAGADPQPIADWDGDEDDPISISYTSGTTGEAKGAVYTHRGAYLRALGVALETGMSASTVNLWTLPMFHCDGWGMPWAVTAVGGRHVCLREVDPELIWEMFVSERVTHYSGAPTVHLSIVEHDSADELEQAITVPTGGAPPSPSLLERMRELNLHPIHLYGLTETYGPAMSCTAHPEWSEKPIDEQAELNARQGSTYNGSDRVRVVDEQMEDVPADGETTGEIVLRGNSVMTGYWNDEEETAEAFEGGWFHSGDIGVMHPDGYVELRDRKKDVIVSGGENISSVEVENVIAGHPAVHEAAVVAIPDEKWGERPKAFVELEADEEIGEDDLLEYCREHLAKFKVPSAVEFCELPRTGTGKVQKFELREGEKADA